VDEEEIADFFANLRISSMRIPREDRSGEGSRLKGFGYVEFEDQQSLLEALSKPSSMLKGRRIRIEVSTSTDNERRRGDRGGGRMDMNRDRMDRPDGATSGDWRSGARASRDDDHNSSGNRRYERRDRERDTNTNDAPGAWRSSADRPIVREPMRRENFPARGESKGFGPRRNANDDYKNGGGEREQRTRPKLNLKPRTLPPPDVPETNESSAAHIEDSVPNDGSDNLTSKTDDTNNTSSAVPAANIFGNAKPVDTATREREIEERLAKLNETKDEQAKKDNRTTIRRKNSPRRENSSPNRRRSPKRYSPPRRGNSSERSPSRRTSPRSSRTRYSPRRYSPRRKNSPRRNSPRRYSPDRRNRYSPSRRRSSERSPPPRRKNSSSSRDRDTSPESVSHQPRSNNNNYTNNKKDDYKGDKKSGGGGGGGVGGGSIGTNNKQNTNTKRNKDIHDMPKRKSPEPLKILSTNQYATLGQSDDSDD